VEILVMGATVVLMAAKYILKFLDYVGKLQTKSAFYAI